MLEARQIRRRCFATPREEAELLELGIDHQLQLRAVVLQGLAHEIRELALGYRLAERGDIRGEIRLELACRRVAILRIRRERPLADLPQTRVDVRPLLERWELSLSELHGDLRPGRVSPELVPEERLGEHHAEREDVRALIDARSAQLLGRHVLELAAEPPGLRVAVRVGGLRDPEVEDLHHPLGSNHDIRRREVSVHDLEQPAVKAFGLVRVLETFEDLKQDVQRDPQRNAAMRHHLLAQAREVSAVEVLHHDVVTGSLLADLVRVDHVWMRELRRESCL